MRNYQSQRNVFNKLLIRCAKYQIEKNVIMQMEDEEETKEWKGKTTNESGDNNIFMLQLC